MDKTVLLHQFARLKTRFGEKAFDAEFTKLAMREVQSLSNAALAKLVDNFLGARPAHKPPLIDDFRLGRLGFEKFNHEHRRKTESSNMANYHCGYCRDTGLVEAIKNGTNYTYMFRCPDSQCVAAKMKCNPHNTTWGPEFLETFTPHFNWEGYSNPIDSRCDLRSSERHNDFNSIINELKNDGGEEF